MLDLSGKRYVIFGVANDKSICWAIAQALMACNAELVFVSHPNLRTRVEALLADKGGTDRYPLYTCDVEVDDQVEECIEQLARHAPYYGLVHGIAYSDKEELKGRFIDMSRPNFRTFQPSCPAGFPSCATASPRLPISA